MAEYAAVMANPAAATASAVNAETVATAVVAPVMARAAPTATTATTDAAPEIRFDNARSILQSLLAESVAHAMIQGDSASAAYSQGGAMFKMSTGADHVQQYIMRDYQPDIPDIVRPISPIARIRGVTERQT